MSGVIRRIDDHEKLTIPTDIRRIFHWSDNEALELIPTKEGLLLKKYEMDDEFNMCVFCKDHTGLRFKGKPVCAQCQRQIVEANSKR